MKESFRVGAALLLKTFYKNVALAGFHLVSKFSQSRDLRRSALVTNASYYSGGPVLKSLQTISLYFIADSSEGTAAIEIRLY